MTHDCEVCHMQPGSETAAEKGCLCPVMDNGRGHNTLWPVVRMDCPVHVNETVRSHFAAPSEDLA